MDAIFARVMCEAYYIISNKCTIREAAEALKTDKSTLHTDVTERLEKMDASLAKEVRAILDKNKSERHIRGGNATKEKHKLMQLGKTKE